MPTPDWFVEAYDKALKNGPSKLWRLIQQHEAQARREHMLESRARYQRDYEAARAKREGLLAGEDNT